MKPKVIIFLVSALLIVVFSLQNAEIVQIKLLFWEITCPRVLLILISVSLGIIVGMFIPRARKQNTQKKEEDEESQESD